MISQEKITKNWHSVVGKVKEKFGQISNDNYSSVQGNIDQLVGLIERKAGQSREQTKKSFSRLQQCGRHFAQPLRKGTSSVQSTPTEMLDDGMKQVSQKAGQGYEYAKDTVARRPAESLAVIAESSI